MESHSDTAAHVGNVYAESDHGDCAFGFAVEEASPGTAGNPSESVGTPTDRSHSQRPGNAGTSAARKRQERSVWRHPNANGRGKSTEGHHAAHQVRPKKGE